MNKLLNRKIIVKLILCLAIIVCASTAIIIGYNALELSRAEAVSSPTPPDPPVPPTPTPAPNSGTDTSSISPKTGIQATL